MSPIDFKVLIKRLKKSLSFNSKNRVTILKNLNLNLFAKQKPPSQKIKLIFKMQLSMNKGKSMKP